MHRRNYYRILGLPETASHQEVKKQYRKLVMQYHPDRNPDKNAQEKFIQLSEAYDIIINNKLPATVKPTTPEEKKKDREERIKTARKRFKEQELRERRENERYFRFLTTGKKWKTLQVLAYVGILLSAMLILDQVLPTHIQEDEVTEYQINIANGPSGQNLSLIKTRTNEYYWISDINYFLYVKNRKMYVEKSWFFHSPIHIISKDKIEPKQFNVHFTFYNASWILILFFLIPMVTLMYKKMTLSFTFLFHLCYYGVSILMLVFLLTGHRWAHIIALGFI